MKMLRVTHRLISVVRLAQTLKMLRVTRRRRKPGEGGGRTPPSILPSRFYNNLLNQYEPAIGHHAYIQ